MVLFRYLYNFLDGNTINNFLIGFVVVGVVVDSFVFLFDGVIVAVDIIIVEYKGWMDGLCEQKGRDVSSNGANFYLHVLLMLSIFWCVAAESCSLLHDAGSLSSAP